MCLIPICVSIIELYPDCTTIRLDSDKSAASAASSINGGAPSGFDKFREKVRSLEPRDVLQYAQPA